MTEPPNTLEQQAQGEQNSKHEILADYKIKYERPKPKTKRVGGRKAFLVSRVALKHHYRASVYRRAFGWLVRLHILRDRRGK
jgi:hypothetical protein